MDAKYRKQSNAKKGRGSSSSSNSGERWRSGTAWEQRLAGRVTGGDEEVRSPGLTLDCRSRPSAFGLSSAILSWREKMVADVFQAGAFHQEVF